MTPAQTAPFAEHIRELRKRIMWVVVFIAIGGVAGYLMHDRLLHLLQLPLNDALYYTTPTGAFSFIMKICVVFGIIVALPVASYQTFAFFGPIIATNTKRIFLIYVTASVILAGAGILFAYYVSLPAALHFLVNFGTDGNVHALITANEYFNFVLAYIAGFAVLFQVPLIIMFTNRFTPLPPKKLFGATKYVVLFSFVVAAIITPTPDPLNQAIMAVPIIALYLFTVLFVALSPRRYKRLKQERRKAQQASAAQHHRARIQPPAPVQASYAPDSSSGALSRQPVLRRQASFSAQPQPQPSRSPQLISDFRVSSAVSANPLDTGM